MGAPWRGLRTRDHLALPLRTFAGPTDLCRCCYGAVDAGWYRPGSCALSTCCPPAEYALEDQRLALSKRDQRLVHRPLCSKGSSDLPHQVSGCDVGCSCHGGSRRLFKSHDRRPRDERRPWLGEAGCIAVRGLLTWQHPDIWDAVRVALIVLVSFQSVQAPAMALVKPCIVHTLPHILVVRNCVRATRLLSSFAGWEGCCGLFVVQKYI